MAVPGHDFGTWRGIRILGEKSSPSLDPSRRPVLSALQAVKLLRLIIRANESLTVFTLHTLSILPPLPTFSGAALGGSAIYSSNSNELLLLLFLREILFARITFKNLKTRQSGITAPPREFRECISPKRFQYAILTLCRESKDPRHKFKTRSETSVPCWRRGGAKFVIISSFERNQPHNYLDHS